MSNAKRNEYETNTKLTVPSYVERTPFDNISSWVQLYKEVPHQIVEMGVCAAFRRRYFLSLAAAAEKIGVSTTTWACWENGTRRMRPSSKKELVVTGWFTPQHFGLEAAAEEFFVEGVA
jgi:hypothetical protein